MKPPTAYSILKELGNDAMHKYIYENIAEPTFDSHRITNPFPQDFRDYYERMLIAHADEGDIRNRNVIIANRIGIYLGRNSRDLQIEKIGEVNRDKHERRRNTDFALEKNSHVNTDFILEEIRLSSK